MKKIPHSVLLFILFSSLSIPFFASAQSGVCDAATEADCFAIGKTCVSGACVSMQGQPSSGTSVPGGININVIRPYSNGIIDVINGILVPVLMAIAFIVFLWGVFKYFIFGASSDTERATGRQFVLWGVIGFVIILSLWGLVNIVLQTFRLSPGGGPPPAPIFSP